MFDSSNQRAMYSRNLSVQFIYIYIPGKPLMHLMMQFKMHQELKVHTLEIQIFLYLNKLITQIKL